MSEHTPGPWRVSDTSIVTDDLCIAVIEDDGSNEAPAGQRKANAILIASAPELLAKAALLEEAVAALDCMYHCFKDYDSNPHDVETLEKARAVLAKIPGGT